MLLWILSCSQNDELNQLNWNLCYFSRWERTTVGVTRSNVESWFLVLIYWSEAKSCCFAWVACWTHAGWKWVSEGTCGFVLLVHSNSRVAHRDEGTLWNALQAVFFFFSLFAQGCCSIYVIRNKSFSLFVLFLTLLHLFLTRFTLEDFTLHPLHLIITSLRVRKLTRGDLVQEETELNIFSHWCETACVFFST